MKLDYELLDTGNGEKWERFGNNRVVRPEKLADWKPQHSQWDYEASYGAKGFVKTEGWNEPWLVSVFDLDFELHARESKNIGLFPEQLSNWKWIAEKIGSYTSRKPKILNLFAYTGAATLIAAKSGAEVCHLDGSKTTVRWASENAKRNNLENLPIRWIPDDALKFMRREVQRKQKYDGVIMDPPPFGHSKKNTFLFKQSFDELLDLSNRLLKERNSFVLINSYALNLKPSEFKGMIEKVFKNEQIKTGELTLSESTGRKSLNISTYARISRD